ncbi:glycosyltransferase family 39 protein [Caulobacter sp. KR2-114]|uniref:glycosyltransferase family 39 protein n=1 Tax=Caulobacter sp. KR2-114 TaxID=3400912 RepID=UPI003BFAE0DA
MTATVTRDLARAPTRGLARAATLGLSVALAGACLFAFVGLNAEGYWTDELFTLFLVNHHGGLAEVWRRALTDTHPPLYYFLLYGWGQAFGLSERSLRALSAIFCVGAVLVFAGGTRRTFSLNARLFAAACGAASPFWFIQSQNVRNYALCLLISAALATLAIQARVAVRAGGRTPLWILVGLVLLGAAGAFSHFYAFLATGILFAFLILTLNDWRLRLGLVVGGLAILAGELAYMRVLLHATQQNTHDMWFRADAGFFAAETFGALKGLLAPAALIGVLALAAAAFWPRRERAITRLSPDAGWSVWLGAAMVGGVIVAGIAISLLFAPSYSNMNLLIAGPYAWPALAALADLGAGRATGRWRGLALAVPPAALVLQLVSQAERWAPRGEPWRETAALVLQQDACAGQPIPVLLPARFGPPTPFFRTLARHDFYGFYFRGQDQRLAVYREAELVDPAQNPTLKPRVAGPGCPVVAWAVHDINRPQAQALADRLALAGGARPGAVRPVVFETWRPVWGYAKRIQAGFVFLRTDAR